MYEISAQDLRYNASELAETYDDFVLQVSLARETGVALGLEDYSRACPGVEEQCKDKWGAFMHKRAQRPTAMVVVSGGMCDIKLPNECPDGSKLKIPKAEFAKLARFEAIVRKEQEAATHVESGGGDDVGGLSDDHEEEGALGLHNSEGLVQSEAYLTPIVAEILHKAEDDRKALKQAKQSDKGDTKMVTESGSIVTDDVLSGNCIFAPDGNLVPTSRVCKVLQMRDHHSHDRGKRFIVGPLPGFAPNAKADHDVRRGSILIVKRGDKKLTFAVVRVLGIVIVEDGKTRETYSWKLDVKNKSMSFMVELMDPVGPPKQSGDPTMTLIIVSSPRITLL